MAEKRAEYAEILRNILTNGGNGTALKNADTDLDRGFVKMLFMTTFRQLAFIKEEVLPQFIKKKIPVKQEILAYILYLGATEILFMNTAQYAVVNSYTQAAKEKTDRFGANFVNAVLRHILREKEKLLTNRKTGYFSKNFLKILKQDYTTDDIKEMEAFAQSEPLLDLTFKTSDNCDRLDGVLLPTGSLRLPSNTKVTEIPYYEDGIWWVQDAASATAVNCIVGIEGKKVLDLCAAPGGKTAQFLSRGAKVTAVDISKKRLNTLEENIKRLRLTENLTIVASDALNFTSKEKFDIVLVDAPCSATGTYRRHPEIIHTKTIEDVKKQALLQKKILAHAADLVAEGGLLVYATCSLAKLEGERQIKDFTAQHPTFQVKSLEIKKAKQMQTKEGFLRILPQHLKNYGGIDGFFVACLQRKN